MIVLKNKMVGWFHSLLLVVVVLVMSSCFSCCDDDDSHSLLSLKASISGYQNALLSSWLPTSDYCSSWYGVTCDNSTRRVISLLLSSSSLLGTLSDSLGLLSHLRLLDLSHNSFSGQIPPSIGHLGQLVLLQLQGNNFSGTIPPQITSLPSLTLVNLSFNSFSGDIPLGLIGHPNLSTIDLSYNKLTGGILLDGSSPCSNLVHLKLSNNFLQQTIPSNISTCTKLRTLLLDRNLIGGSIPPEIGLLSELRVLDLSTNSLTNTIPVELANCHQLSVLILTNASNLVGGGYIWDDVRLEFNAFEGGLPHGVYMLPNLQIIWAPRANLEGPLPTTWNSSCSLRVVHLGMNSFSGPLPPGLGMCPNLTYLDLSCNFLTGDVPPQLPLPCMLYLNVSANNFTSLPSTFAAGACDPAMLSFGQDANFLDAQDMQIASSSIPFWGPPIWPEDEDLVIIHDFSSNRLVGSLPLFSVGDELLAAKNKYAYRLLLNNNKLNGSFPGQLVADCYGLESFSVNMSSNHISGEIHELLLANCTNIRGFEAAYNQIGGSLSPPIGNLTVLQYLDLRGNKLSGTLPTQLGDLKFLKALLLGSNHITGQIPSQLGQLDSLANLDLSHNALSQSIPASLTEAQNLVIVLLDDNCLSGEIPPAFSNLSNLRVLDVSLNNLSGPIPRLGGLASCKWFAGNSDLGPCPYSNTSVSESGTPSSGERNHKLKKAFVIAVVVCASLVLVVSLVVGLGGILMYKRRKSTRISSLRGNAVVTFADAPAELSYDSVVRATGNFSVRYLIGTGGFGATYKAEIAPGCLVAVKRLSIGRVQGSKQFDAEIRTLGRVRHKKLVTLMGYYVGNSEMFLIYNYLSGGNLETFIHEKAPEKVEWGVIYKIALDIAQALAYLHYSCVPRILHRDIKPSNILLDEELNAYLSDFGLARLLEVSQTHATTDVAGTFGYVAPEYATTCRVSEKSDVYSFGVVMLELLSGKKSLDPSFSQYGNGFNVVAWAMLLIKEGRPSEIFSRDLWESGPRESLMGMLNLASASTLESLSVRPSMKQVVDKLKQFKA